MALAAGFGTMLATILVLAPAARGAAPPNDNFELAAAIEGASGSIMGANVEATRQLGEPSHGGSSQNSVWYRWTSPVTGSVSFETCVATFDTLLAVYSGDALASLRQLDANDDSCELGSRVTVQVTALSVYYVAVDGLDGAQGQFTLRWSRAVSPSNDAFASARRLSGIRGTTQGTNANATAETSEPRSLRPHRSSVWYSWRAPRNLRIAFSTCGAPFDTFLAVFTGRAVNALTLLAQNDDACGFSSRVTLQAQRGRLYHVAVAGLDGATGRFRLRWEVSSCRVPAVVGRMEAQARRVILRAGCSVGPVRRARSILPPVGVILAQWPRAGTELPFRGAVHLLVSLGPG